MKEDFYSYNHIEEIKNARSTIKASDELIKSADVIYESESKNAGYEFCDERIRAGSSWDLVRTHSHAKYHSAMKDAYYKYINKLKDIKGQ